MKLFLLLIATAASLLSQTTGLASRTNSNTYQAGKTQTFLGVVDAGGATRTSPCRRGNGTPTGQNGTQGDCYYQNDATAGQNEWWATTTGTPATWTLQAGAGGGGSAFTGSTASTSSFSATPTFSLADVSTKSPTRFEPGALTANVTAVTFSNKTAGAKFSIAWLQNGVGGFTVAYGASASNTCVVLSTASSTTTQNFEVKADGTTVVGTGCSVSGAPNDLLFCVAGSTSGNICVYGPASGGGTVSFPAGTYAVVGDSISQTLTTKTIDTASNTLKVAGTTITALSGTGGVLCTSVGSDCAVGSAFSPGTFYEYDEFLPCCAFGAYGKGKLGWAGYASSGTGNDVADIAGLPGVLRLFTAGADNDTAGIALDGSLQFLTKTILKLNSLTWHTQFIVHTDPFSAASVSYEMGFADGQGYRNANSITIRSDTTSQTCTAGSNSTANFLLETISGASSNCVSLGVAQAADTTYLFDLSGASGTISAKVSTDNGSTWSSPVTSSTHVPSASLFPKFLVTARTAAVRILYVDRWETLITGLTRP